MPTPKLDPADATTGFYVKVTKGFLSALKREAARRGESNLSLLVRRVLTEWMSGTGTPSPAPRPASGASSKAGPLVPLAEIVKRFAPILKELRDQGKRHPALMVPIIVWEQAILIGRLFEEWQRWPSAPAASDVAAKLADLEKSRAYWRGEAERLRLDLAAAEKELRVLRAAAPKPKRPVEPTPNELTVLAAALHVDARRGSDLTPQLAARLDRAMLVANAMRDRARPKPRRR